MAKTRQMETCTRNGDASSEFVWMMGTVHVSGLYGGNYLNTVNSQLSNMYGKSSILVM
jgi:hypothetical protein